MSDFIPEDFIQKVLEDSDIVSLVDSYVPLKRKGKDHWAQCPFCDDGSNPSFSVSDQKQFYYCFKCRASGNAIGFLMNYFVLMRKPKTFIKIIFLSQRKENK